MWWWSTAWRTPRKSWKRTWPPPRRTWPRWRKIWHSCVTSAQRLKSVSSLARRGSIYTSNSQFFCGGMWGRLNQPVHKGNNQGLQRYCYCTYTEALIFYRFFIKTGSPPVLYMGMGSVIASTLCKNLLWKKGDGCLIGDGCGVMSLRYCPNKKSDANHAIKVVPNMTFLFEHQAVFYSYVLK